MTELTIDLLLEYLRLAVKRTSDFMDNLTDYHGGEQTTEYMLTADIAREFLVQSLPVEVEYLNRKLLNASALRKNVDIPKKLRSARTDVALVKDGWSPLAMIEVKIRVKKLRAVKGDLEKIALTMGLMKARVADKVIGAVVFQTHVTHWNHKPTNRIENLKQATVKLESDLENELNEFARDYTGESFSFHSLQKSDVGIVEGDEDDSGHATRYHAILIRSRRPVPPRAHGFEGIRQLSKE